jgi:hypothetical protein
VPDLSVYILPRGPISPDATNVHGIEKKSGKLFVRGNPVPAVDPVQGMHALQESIL